jgi:hypothetical protein
MTTRVPSGALRIERQRPKRDKGENIHIFTTNWDQTVDRALKQYGLSVTHLHGSTEEGKTLYLPTEIVDEPYRNSDERRTLFKSLYSLIEAVEKSQRLVLYGLSLSALDVELATGLATDPEGTKPKQLVIIDPSHIKIRKRVATLFKPEKLKDTEISCIDPNKLREIKKGCNGD